MSIWKKIIVASVLGLLLYSGIYIYAQQSDGFKFVQQAILKSHDIQQHVGNVQSVNLSLLGSYDAKQIGSDQVVTMSVEVVGTKSTRTIDVKATLKDDLWKIDNASLDGGSISLN